MRREANILNDLASATDPVRQRELAAELRAVRTQALRQDQSSRGRATADRRIAATHTPVHVHTHHTAATDWLGGMATAPEAESVHREATAEATSWFQRTSAAVKADAGELATQAQWYASRWAGQFGEQVRIAHGSFLQRASHLAGFKITSGKYSEIEQWCDSQGVVMKDFPDDLIEQAADTGNTSILSEWLEGNDPYTSDDGDARYPKADDMSFESSRRTASEDAVCATCGKPAQNYCYQEGTRASGSFACDDHVDRYREGRTVEKISRRRVASRKVAWTIADARKVLDTQSFQTVDGMLLDHFSASALVQIYDAVNDENKAKLEAMSLDRAMDVVWKLVNKTSSLRVTARSISDIARDIRADWKNVNYGAVPYLDAMRQLDSINDMYYADPAHYIVNYFLANATSWRGEKAKAIKAELKEMVAQRGKTSSSRTAAPSGLYPDTEAAGVTTWADGYGNWHATADSTEEAAAAIQAQIEDRAPRGGSGYKVKVKLVDGRHYVEASLRTTTASDGDRSFCRICGHELEQMEHAWYALKSSAPQRPTSKHYCIPARMEARPGEFGPDGKLAPGSPGGEGGQYDAPAGTIFDSGANPIAIARRRTAAADALFAAADEAYGRNDQGWFDALSKDDLLTLWAAVSGENFLTGVQTYAWDDEVYDALANKGHDFATASLRHHADQGFGPDEDSQSGGAESQLPVVDVSADETFEFGWSQGDPEGADEMATDGVGPFDAARKTAANCSCAHNTDGSVTKFLCPIHADDDPCFTMAMMTGRRRNGSIVRGVCTNCGWTSKGRVSSLRTASAYPVVIQRGTGVHSAGPFLTKMDADQAAEYMNGLYGTNEYVSTVDGDADRFMRVPVSYEQWSADFPRSASLTAGSKGESATCATCDGGLEHNGKRWVHSDASNNDHGPLPKNEDGSGRFPVNSSRRTAVSLTNVGFEGGIGSNVGVGTDPQGNRVRFRLSDKEAKDLAYVLTSDLAVNFSGVDVEQSDIIATASRRHADQGFGPAADSQSGHAESDLDDVTVADNDDTNLGWVDDGSGYASRQQQEISAEELGLWD